MRSGEEPPSGRDACKNHRMKVLTLLLVALSAACSSAEPATSPSATPAPTQVTGLITELVFDGDQLLSLSVESRDGPVEVLIDGEHNYGFNLKHLEQHRTKEQPVLIYVEGRDDSLYATDILDA